MEGGQLLTLDDSIGFGLVLGVAFWAAAIGGIAALGAWALIMFGSTAREIREARTKGAAYAAAVASAIPEPAEEGGQLNEWEESRRDRAA